MQLTYKDYFSLVAVTRLGRLFNHYNRAVQAHNHATERQLGLNPGALTENIHYPGHLRDNARQYEATLKFAEQGLMALGEHAQAESVADMQDEAIAGKAYVAFISQMEGQDPDATVDVDDARFCQHAQASLDYYRQRNQAHVKLDVLDATMSEVQQVHYREGLSGIMNLRMCGNADGQVHHLKKRIESVAPEHPTQEAG